MPRTHIFHEIVDAIEKWERDVGANLQQVVDEPGRLPVTCHTCTNASPGCCHQKVFITVMEALPIVRYLKRYQLDTPELRAQLETTGVAMEADTRDGWFRGNHPCVFLQEGRCSIYKVRPIACRTFWVVTPQELCQPDFEGEVGVVSCDGILRDTVDHAFDVHRALNLKENHQRILLGALPRVLSIVINAWESDNYVSVIRQETWPTLARMDAGWVEGNNPFRERLYQIRSTKTV